MTNPVVELIQARVTAGSVPGARTDGALLGLCIEGGAMRGVVSAGMGAAIEQLHLLHAFDVVIGASAGAANGAYLVAGRATIGATIYYENINKRSFIDGRRALARRPVVDLALLVGDVMTRQKPLDTAAILRSPIPLVIVASNVETGEGDVLRDWSDGADLLGCIRASATMPILAGPPYAHRGNRYWDGSLTQPVPLDTAARLGCTHVLALLTRPAGVGRPALSFFQRRVILPRIRRVSPPLADRFARQRDEYSRLMARLDSRQPQDGPQVFALRPAGPPVGNLERRHAVLVDGARQGFSAVRDAFDGAVNTALAGKSQDD
jgi:predicted patatin/cPLA2 family phospholipase